MSALVSLQCSRMLVALRCCFLPQGNGAGIYAEGSRLTVADSTFENGVGAAGGAVYLSASAVGVIRNTTVRHHSIDIIILFCF